MATLSDNHKLADNNHGGQIMNKLLLLLVVGALLALPMLTPAPASAQDDYWTNHWNWYDNTYRPYYYRNYSYYGPGYNNYYSPGYNYGYAPGYYNNPYGYGYTPYQSYYGAGPVGVGRMYGGGSAVNVGPLRFGWR
jgi:hypothetical protein